jgi:hypothetical protein
VLLDPDSSELSEEKGVHKPYNLFQGGCLLEKEINFRIQIHGIPVRVFDAGDEDKFRFAVPFHISGECMEPKAVQSRHPDVRDDQVDILGGQDFTPFHAIGRSVDRIAMRVERIAEKIKVVRIVIDKQNIHAGSPN